MDDLISRQAALKELAAYIHLIAKTMGKGLLTDDDCMEAAKSVLGEDELPAVQPATNCSEIPNSSDDTISRQAAIEALARMMPRSYTPDGSHPADEEIFRAQEVFADCIEALEILPSAQSEPTQEIQDILDYLDTVLHPIVSPEHWDVYSKLHDMVSGLPSAQLDGIPLEWIDKHLEWLDNCDNDFAQLAKVSIKAMVELWKKDRI